METQSAQSAQGEEKPDTTIKVVIGGLRFEKEMTNIFRELIYDFKSNSNGVSPIRIGFEINRPGTTGSNEFCIRKNQSATKKFEKILKSHSFNDPLEKSMEIFKIWFTMLNDLENQFAMSVCDVVWSNSISILVKKQNDPKEYRYLKQDIRTGFENIFKAIGKKPDVQSVSVELLSPREASQYMDDLN